uniref:Helicase ATP-binding domain-containing protein n=1 Tax=Syphacia muris TaxID=451379 RepID=A0A0N5AXY6_9BILA
MFPGEQDSKEWRYLAARPLTKLDVEALKELGGVPARIICPMTLDKEAEAVFNSSSLKDNCLNLDDDDSYEYTMFSEEELNAEENYLQNNGVDGKLKVIKKDDSEKDGELDALMRTTAVALKDKIENFKDGYGSKMDVANDYFEDVEKKTEATVHIDEEAEIAATSGVSDEHSSGEKSIHSDINKGSLSKVSNRKCGKEIGFHKSNVKNKNGDTDDSTKAALSSNSNEVGTGENEEVLVSYLAEKPLKKPKRDKLERLRLNLSDSDESSEESTGRLGSLKCGKRNSVKRKRIISSSSSDDKLEELIVNSKNDSYDDDIEEFTSDISVVSSDSDISSPKKKRVVEIRKVRIGVKKKRRRVRIDEDSSDTESISSDVCDEDNNDDNAELRRRRGIKPIMERTKLAKETIDAEIAEKERRKRLEAKQKEFNGIELVDSENLSTALDSSQTRPLLKRVVLDPDTKGSPPCPVEVDSNLVKYLKPHQAEGIKFLYESTIESLELLGEDGGGGILAHCMGLGKTLQVIAFLHTILNHPSIQKKIYRILIITPKNVVLQWCSEFAKWLDSENNNLNSFEVIELDSFKSYYDRYEALKNWHKSKVPVVMVIGYDMFRILTQEDNLKSKKGSTRKVSKQNRKLSKFLPFFREYLQDPGPDLIVCDEAHKLKNEESALTKCMTKIRTKRRICLTGTPLQNNLMEYHCMVNFVKPGLLGTKKEFANRFANIINRGKTRDATAMDVRHMKRRCHVLFEKLRKVVDRKDHNFLTEVLPPKQEYVINVRLTSRQVALYRAFLDGIGKDDITLGKRLLPDYHILSRIWTHPFQLITHDREEEKKRILQEDRVELEDFINDGDITTSNDDDVVLIESDEEAPAGPIRKSKRLAGEEAEFESGSATPIEYHGWFSDTGLVSGSDENDFSLGRKLVLLQAIIKKCEEIGDKLLAFKLVFSQSLESLNLIKRMLQYMDNNNLWFADGHEALKKKSERWGWVEGQDYLTHLKVIDGQVQSARREELQKKFNDDKNLRARLMLISTRAGSLGTNMVAANRVIIFDACWNPSHDTQSLFRVYRFGQKKPVYIYRLIAQGTMEERIYKRQVTKESTSMRVIDEAQIERHFGIQDLEELYKFDPDESNSEDSSQAPSIAPPKDRLLADVIFSNRECIVSYIQHDSLFKNLVEEKLSEEECREAWNDYENEKNVVNRFNSIQQGGLFQPWHERRNELGRVVPNGMEHYPLPLNADPIYLKAYQVRGMDMETAIKISFVKQCLDKLLPSIPVGLRGDVTEFYTTFHNLINRSVQQGNSPSVLLADCIRVFRTVVGLVRKEPTCFPTLQQLYNCGKELFDSSFVVPP